MVYCAADQVTMQPLARTVWLSLSLSFAACGGNTPPPKGPPPEYEQEPETDAGPSNPTPAEPAPPPTKGDAGQD